jgi:hypothetical protein
MTKEMKICIVGAGPAGMSMAWYLAKAGYTQVKVLEKRNRVGGMCDSFTYDNDSFDVGANYVTSDYTEVLALARELGAALHTDTAFQNQVTLDVKTGTIGSTSAVVNSGHTLLCFIAAIFRYFWYQFKYRKIVYRPNMIGITDYPELNLSFGEFLTENGMLPLWKIFMLPITAMGYGQLDDVPAVYALRYMNAGRFFSMLLTGLKIPQNWPKRFNDGFQRLWIRASWRLNVQLSIDVQRIERNDQVVNVTYNDASNESHVEEFDLLVLACPFDHALNFLDASAMEKKLFSNDVIKYMDFRNTTSITEDFPYQVVNELMLPDLAHGQPGRGVFPKNDGHPWIFGKQELTSKLTLFYSSVEMGTPEGDVQKVILNDCELTFRAAGKGKFIEWYTHRTWNNYFPHVSSDQIYDFDSEGRGYYDVFESQQGINRTFYVGGLLSFELVESIMKYTKNLVEQRF